MKITELNTVLELAPGYPQEADPNTIYTWLNSVYGETFEFVPKGPDKEDDKSSMQQAGQPAKQEDKLIWGEEDEQKQENSSLTNFLVWDGTGNIQHRQYQHTWGLG
jgi:hypothetical protein